MPQCRPEEGLGFLGTSPTHRASKLAAAGWVCLLKAFNIYFYRCLYLYCACASLHICIYVNTHIESFCVQKNSKYFASILKTKSKSLLFFEK